MEGGKMAEVARKRLTTPFGLLFSGFFIEKYTIMILYIVKKKWLKNVKIFWEKWQSKPRKGIFNYLKKKKSTVMIWYINIRSQKKKGDIY